MRGFLCSRLRSDCTQWANGSAAEFDSILRNFNDEQMMRPSDGKPVMQQQQKVQPQKEDDKN